MFVMKIKLTDGWDGYQFKRFNNCEDLVDYLKSLNIYRSEMNQIFSYPADMLYFFKSHLREVPDSDELNFLAIKYPHLLKVSNEN